MANRTQLNAYLRRALPLEYSYSRLQGQSESDCHLLCQSEYLDPSTHVVCFGTPFTTILTSARTVAAGWSGRPLHVSARGFAREKHNASKKLDRESIGLINHLCPRDFELCDFARTKIDAEVISRISPVALPPTRAPQITCEMSREARRR